MPDPVIKKEESPETSVMAMAPTMPSAMSTSNALIHAPRPASDAEDFKPLRSTPPPKGIARHMPLARSPYHGSSPRRYKITGQYSVGITSPRFLARLPSRLTSATATGHVNKATATTTTVKTSTAQNISHISELLQRSDRLGQHKSGIMDSVEFGDDEVGGGDLGFPVLPSMMDIGMHTDSEESEDNTVSSSQFELEQLQGTVGALQVESSRQRRAIAALANVNHCMFHEIKAMRDRLADLEHVSRRFDTTVVNNIEQRFVEQLSTTASRANVSHRPTTDDRSRSPSPSRPQYRQRDLQTNREDLQRGDVAGRNKNEKTKFRKELHVTIPGKPTGLPAAGLPTPTTAASLRTGTSMTFPVTPKTPFTPGRIGPGNAYKKTTTSVNKRHSHNLDKTIPPTYVQFPQLPLTDTELIVYFYNSLARPIVALRLYARNWGPASIVQALNDHRVIDPPYLRNTCSVKCTTAIKTGKRRFGDDWEEANRVVFVEASDDRATDLVRLSGADLDNAVDYDVRALSVNLKKHPQGDDAGIFTRCVEYCQEHNAPYTLSNVSHLAMAIEAGTTPVHPPSPIPTPSSYRTPRFTKLPPRQQKQAAKSDGELAATLSPTVNKNVPSIRFGHADASSSFEAGVESAAAHPAHDAT
ncbi:hypothetical protein P153DRAFT_398177 [Dothidotthia symphoricarpi CBS 119687]|uniref:Uncharacterized protein n=1 Tax=Dothidotthia symphoricarpi CBS 119687 TaxID=1392245 RepID=A0A6A6A6Q4_9PLEO|nr:uncharacterized protein P153DRAFT_398177 [Dothidotthia symphoricarpi CBS 119687]KAF2127569.1 hypothetical protein P153DRAFT_398177 [Dothidotthia symphoricarpi CBS 119687]